VPWCEFLKSPGTLLAMLRGLTDATSPQAQSKPRSSAPRDILWTRIARFGAYCILRQEDLVEDISCPD